MTYRQLRKYLQEMDDSRLDDDAIILDEDNGEFFHIKSFKKVKDSTDFLYEGQAFLSYYMKMVKFGN